MSDAAPDWERGKAIEVGRASLWVDVQGATDADPVVLLAGADTPGFRWTPALVSPLLDAGHRVVRFDHRDCGRSSRLPLAEPYRLSDMADDVIALLDDLEIDSAHLIGRSMGGMIAQELALDHPTRVVSLTLIATTPGSGDERLSGPDDAFVEQMTERLFVGPPGDRAARIDWIVERAELMSGTLYSFDPQLEASLACAELDTGWTPESGHGVAVFASPSRLDRLGEISAPSLVVHGTADPVFGIDHGRSLAEGIPGAVFVEVDGLGHELPDGFVAELWPVLAHHLKSSRRF